MSTWTRCDTIAVRTGIESDTQYGAVVPPIHLSSNYTFAEFGRPRRFDYSRSGNPTRAHLGAALADLEGGQAGVVTATGMAAITAVLQLLKPQDLLLAPIDCYGGSFRLFDSWARRGAFQLEWIDFRDPAALEQVLARQPRMVWLETPSNPLLRITDIEAVTTAAHTVDALVVADNTFLSPILQKPIELGVDIVVHSTTKYINGHSDVVGGAVIAADAAVGDELAWWANCIGVTGGGFDAWLTLRGLRTLGARLAVHQDNAAGIVDLLVGHPAVERVHYPGLSEDPGHLLARRQQRGFGAMISFELTGGTNAARECVSRLKLFSLAESLGGVESLVAHPATMTHAAMSAEDQRRAGIGGGLLRLSVGLESLDDLREDLRAALDSVAVLAALSDRGREELAGHA